MVCAVDQTPFQRARVVEAPAVARAIRRKIPLPLSIVTCYLIASGLFQICWSFMIGQYFGSAPVLNVVYGALILVVSRGLRRGLRRWYVCALVVTGLILLGIFAEIVRGMAYSASLREFCFYLLDITVWLWILVFLMRQDIREFFYGEHNIAT
jgi:hypothetical protein